MLGSNSAVPGAPPVFEYPFVKAKDVRREILVATEVRDVTNVHDYIFNGVTPSLVPTSQTNTADYQAIAGTPHQGGTSGNMLFADGQIRTDNINKLLGPPPKEWIVNWQVPQTGNFPF